MSAFGGVLRALRRSTPIGNEKHRKSPLSERHPGGANGQVDFHLLTAVAPLPGADGTGLIVGGSRGRISAMESSDGLMDARKSQRPYGPMAGVAPNPDACRSRYEPCCRPLYRSAIITKAAGHSRFFTVKLEIQNQLASNIVVSNSVYWPERGLFDHRHLR